MNCDELRYMKTRLKDLDVTIDASLTFDEHVTNLVSSCTGINKAKYLLDKQTMSIIINVLVFSKLYYCSSVWGNTSKKNLDKTAKSTEFCCPNFIWHKKISVYNSHFERVKLASCSS